MLLTTAKLAADCITAAKIGDNIINSEHYAADSIDNEHLAADCVTGTEIANDSLNSEHYVAGSIDNEHLAADCVGGSNIGDNVINSEHIAAGAVDLEHMASQSVDEDNLYISNAGSNGQFLSKQSGNNGGLTWADAGGGGKVLQCISYTGSSSVTLSAGTGMTDIISLSITPSDSSSKILVQVNVSYYKQTTAVANASYQITRGSTNIDSTYWHYADSAHTNWWMPYQLQVLDSPSTTSSTTYKFRLSNSGGNTIGAHTPTKITLWEIGA